MSKVASYGQTVDEAYMKALKSTGFKIPKKAVLFGIQEDFQSQMLEAAQLFSKQGLEVENSLSLFMLTYTQFSH